MRADRRRRAELFGRVLERLRSILGSLCFLGRIGPGAKEGVTLIPESNYDWKRPNTSKEPTMSGREWKKRR